MKKILLTLTVIPLLLVLVSCELFLEKPLKPTIHALFIGLDYSTTNRVYIEGEPYGLSYLSGTIGDVFEVAVSIEQLSGTTYFDFAYEVVLMTEEDGYTPPSGRLPTRDNVLAQLAQFSPGGGMEVKEHDIFLLYYAGHGGEDGYPLLLSSEHSNLGTYVTEKELNDSVGAIAGTKVIILDTCHSGQIVEEYPRTASDRQSATYHANLFSLTASSASQVSREDDFPSIGHRHGYFSLYFLDAIGWNHISEDNSTATLDGREISVPGEMRVKDDIPTYRNGTILLGDAYRYIINNFRYAEQWITFQTPQTSGGPKDLVLFSDRW